jgi:hypothetical protein
MLTHLCNIFPIDSDLNRLELTDKVIQTTSFLFELIFIILWCKDPTSVPQWYNAAALTICLLALGSLSFSHCCLSSVSAVPSSKKPTARIRYHSRFFVRIGHLVKIFIFSLYHVTVRPTKIINNLLRDNKTLSIKSQSNLSSFFSLKNIRLGDQLLLMTFFENFFIVPYARHCKPRLVYFLHRFSLLFLIKSG